MDVLAWPDDVCVVWKCSLVHLCLVCHSVQTKVNVAAQFIF